LLSSLRGKYLLYLTNQKLEYPLAVMLLVKLQQHSGL